MNGKPNPTRYRYMVSWRGREHYCEAATEAEACKSAAEAWVPELPGVRKVDLYAELILEAAAVRLRKIQRPKITL